MMHRGYGHALPPQEAEQANRYAVPTERISLFCAFGKLFHIGTVNSLTCHKCMLLYLHETHFRIPRHSNARDHQGEDGYDERCSRPGQQCRCHPRYYRGMGLDADSGTSQDHTVKMKPDDDRPAPLAQIADAARLHAQIIAARQQALVWHVAEPAEWAPVAVQAEMELAEMK